MKKILFFLMAFFVLMSSLSFAEEIPSNGTEVIFYAKDVSGNPTHSGVWDIMNPQGQTLWRVNLITQDQDRVILTDGEYKIKQVGAKPGYEIDTRVIDLKLPIFQDGVRAKSYKIYTKEVKKIVEEKERERERDREPIRDPYIEPEVERLPRPTPVITPEPEKNPPITIDIPQVPLSVPQAPVEIEDEEPPKAPIQITTPKHTGATQIPFGSFMLGSLSLSAAGALGMKKKK